MRKGELAGKNLKELLQEYQGTLVGEKVYERFGDVFPLLIKFIDANDDLSIQVHPDDALAKKRHNSFGKTEMWYIIQADEGTKLISGFNQPMTKEKYQEVFEEGHLMDVLNKEDVHANDVFFLPAGRVHTIGKGLLLTEIQQTSDITYRIYDFDRKDAEGNTRELHVDQALDAIDYQQYDDYKTRYEPKTNEPVSLVDCPYFETLQLHYTHDTDRDLASRDSFTIYIGLEGESDILCDGQSYAMKKGDVYLIPASVPRIEFKTTSGFKVLESYVPSS